MNTYETVRELSAIELEHIAGGGYTDYSGGPPPAGGYHVNSYLGNGPGYIIVRPSGITFVADHRDEG